MAMPRVMSASAGFYGPSPTMEALRLVVPQVRMHGTYLLVAAPRVSLTSVTIEIEVRRTPLIGIIEVSNQIAADRLRNDAGTDCFH
jgi:hypothetical protein